MPYPDLYDVTYSYTGFQQSQGDNSFPGTQIDADLAGLQSSVFGTAAFLQNIIRSDGRLKNGIVTIDSLSSEFTLEFPLATAWQTATAYSTTQSVVQASNIYRAAVAHTSGVFATDLAAGKWTFIAALPAGPQGPVGAGATLDVTQRGTGAVTRPVAEKNYERVSVNDFRAVIDADDTNAFDRALTAALTYSQAVYVPSGTYTVSATLIKSIAANAKRGLFIYGDGSELSVIKFTNAGDGFNITLNNFGVINGNRLVMQGLTLATTNAAGGSAIKLIGGGGNSNEIGPLFFDVTCKGYDGVGGWQYGWNFSAITKTIINSCTYIGKSPSAYSEANMAGIGIAYDGNGDHDVDNCHFTYFDKAISMAGNMEGVFVTNCQMVAGNWGVYANSTSNANGITYLTMENCHVNTYSGVFHAGWCNWIKITGVFSILFNAGTPVGPYIGYDISGDATIPGRSIIISKNIINLDTRTYSVTGISANYLSGAVFEGNSFENNQTTKYGVGLNVSNSVNVKFNSNAVRGLDLVAFVASNNRAMSFSDNSVDSCNVGFSFAGSVSSRTVNVVIADNNFSGIVNQCMSLDSIDRCAISGNVDTSAAPSSGSWVTNGTHASKGSYIFSGNLWSTAAQTIFDAASTYNYTNEKNLQPNADMVLTPATGKKVSVTGDLTVSGAVRSSAATLQVTPSNPAATSSTTDVMMGLGGVCKITPVNGTRAHIEFHIGVANGAIANATVLQVRYGTGTAPANGVGVAGTALGAAITVSSPGASFQANAVLGGVITGLTPGTQYWFDVAMHVQANTSTIQAIDCNAFEF